MPINQRYLVEKKESDNTDTRWYNLYSDGYCEQGGHVIFSSGATQTINLLKTFKDTDYNITSATIYDAAVMYSTTIKTSNKTTSSFQIVAFDTLPTADWRACGYISTTKSQSVIKY